jgi:hypothetical protein
MFTTAGCTASTMSAKLEGAPASFPATTSSTLGLAAAGGVGPTPQSAVAPKTTATRGTQYDLAKSLILRMALSSSNAWSVENRAFRELFRNVKDS